jgi:hypothetical protein
MDAEEFHLPSRSVTDFGRFDGVPGLWLKLGTGLVAPKASGGQTRGMTTPNDIAFHVTRCGSINSLPRSAAACMAYRLESKTA